MLNKKTVQHESVCVVHPVPHVEMKGNMSSQTTAILML